MGASAANNLCNPSSAAIIGAFSLVASRSCRSGAVSPTPRLRPAPPLGRARRPEASRPEDPGSRPVPERMHLMRGVADEREARDGVSTGDARRQRKRAQRAPLAPTTAGGGSNAGPPTTPRPNPNLPRDPPPRRDVLPRASRASTLATPARPASPTRTRTDPTRCADPPTSGDRTAPRRPRLSGLFPSSSPSYRYRPKPCSASCTSAAKASCGSPTSLSASSGVVVHTTLLFAPSATGRSARGPSGRNR